MQKKFIFGFILYLVFSNFALMAKPEKIEIRGKVSDANNNPLPFANVFLKGRVEGATTNEKGEFFFHVKHGGEYILVAKYIGYQSWEKKITLTQDSQPFYNITLKQVALKSEAVSVTASSFTTADKEGVTLTPLEIVTTPGSAADIFWAIKSFPGLQQVDEGAGLFIRGGDVSENIILLDGAILNHPYRYESPTGGFFGTISPFLLKGTYFSSGAFSARFGNALSGALSMESLDLPETARASLGLGLAAYSMMLRVPLIDEKLGFSCSGNKSNTRAMFKLNQGRTTFTQYPESYDVNLNAIYRYSTSGYFKFFVFTEDDKIGVETYQPIGESGQRGIFTGSSHNQLYNLIWSSAVGSKLWLKSNIAFSQFDSDREMQIFKMKQRDKLTQWRFDAEYRCSPKLEILAGMEVQNKSDRFRAALPVEENRYSEGSLVRQFDYTYTSYRGGSYFELNADVSAHTFMSLGTRINYENKSDEVTTDHRFSMNYEVQPHHVLRFGLGNFHQYPEPHYFDTYYGNPALKPAKAFHTILGYEFTHEQNIYRVEAYNKQYDHLILEDENFRFTSQGYGHAYGVDIFIKRNLGLFSGWIAYSYLIARRKEGQFNRLTSPDFDITHNLNWVLKVQLSEHLSLGSLFKYATGKPYTPAYRQFNSQRVPDFHKLDLSLSYLSQFWEGNLTIFYLSVSNVYGRKNIYDYHYNEDYTQREAQVSSFDRSVYFGISANF